MAAQLVTPPHVRAMRRDAQAVSARRRMRRAWKARQAAERAHFFRRYDREAIA